MKIRICEISVNSRLREAAPGKVQELADSIETVGLLNPITVDQDYTLIAGLHRLEAVKRLGWLEVECTVCDLEGLKAELAEIDENLVRNNFSDIEYGDFLLRRKEVYEALHPDTKAGVSQAIGMNRAVGNNVAAKMATTSKSFVDDTAEKLGIGKRTVRRHLQIAKNLTPEAKNIIQSSEGKITQKETENISHLPPEQQSEAARQIVSKAVHAKSGGKPAQPSQPSVQSQPEPSPAAPPPAELPPPENTKPEEPARDDPGDVAATVSRIS